MKRLLIGLVLLCAASPASADITSATHVSSARLSGNVYKVIVRLVTNDERGTFDDRFDVPGPATAMSLANTRLFIRDEVSKRIAAMNFERGTSNALAGVAVGTNIPVTYSAPSAPAPTARDVWVEKAARLQRLKAIGLTNGTAVSEVNALEADVNATYQAGFAASF